PQALDDRWFGMQRAAERRAWLQPIDGVDRQLIPARCTRRQISGDNVRGEAQIPRTQIQQRGHIGQSQQLVGIPGPANGFDDFGLRERTDRRLLRGTFRRSPHGRRIGGRIEGRQGRLPPHSRLCYLSFMRLPTLMFAVAFLTSTFPPLILPAAATSERAIGDILATASGRTLATAEFWDRLAKLD